MASKRCSSRCTTTNSTQMLKSPWRGYESKLVIYLLGKKGRRYDYLVSYRAIGPLRPDLFALLRFRNSVSMERSWPVVIGHHDLKSGLRSPNKKILDKHIVKVHGLIPHANFHNHRSLTVGPSEGLNLNCITSVGLVWWPEVVNHEQIVTIVLKDVRWLNDVRRIFALIRFFLFAFPILPP